MSPLLKIPIFDLAGTGAIYVGEGGAFVVMDEEGNVSFIDSLKGMKFGEVTLCTETANMDENASCALANMELRYRVQY